MATTELDTSETESNNEERFTEEQLFKYIEDNVLRKIQKKTDVKELQNEYASLYAHYLDYNKMVTEIMERQKNRIEDLQRTLDQYSTEGRSSSSSSGANSRGNTERGYSSTQFVNKRHRKRNLQTMIKNTENIHDLNNLLQDYLDNTYDTRLNTRKTNDGFTSSSRHVKPREIYTKVGEDNDIPNEFKRKYMERNMMMEYNRIMGKDETRLDRGLQQRKDENVNRSFNEQSYDEDGDDDSEKSYVGEPDNDSDYENDDYSDESESEMDYVEKKEKKGKKGKKKKKEKKKRRKRDTKSRGDDDQRNTHTTRDGKKHKKR